LRAALFAVSAKCGGRRLIKPAEFKIRPEMLKPVIVAANS